MAQADPALNMLNRALNGDHSALSFLDRTSSIYLLDATDPCKPKTYGGWNFIHQAMNEIERNEAGCMKAGKNASLTGHVQLLATMAQRVARRSPATDRGLVATCIANAAQYHASESEAQSLISLNSEIREIVMGRIAAMAFDVSFHSQRSMYKSAFSDPVAMEKLCSVLAVNAVASGPMTINHFMKEWIIPSLSSLPPFAVACVTYHLAIEALSKTSPAGTKDTLQSLSHAVVGCVLAPVLVDSVGENSESSNYEWNCRLVSISLRALERWCAATDLSLPQIKHICAKRQINFIALISDALYSDSAYVVEAMAELLEVCIKENGEEKVSKERMTQARYIMEVGEDAFRSITPEDLFRIEVKEMEDVLAELVTGVGLQRFRFSERQAKGDHGVCRNLTRIAAKVGNATVAKLISGKIPTGASGLLELLMKAGAHPHVHISSIAIIVLSQLLSIGSNFTPRLLPLLQHRAIIPYVLNGSVPSLAASSSSGVDFYEFENFRQNVLVEALQRCYEQNSKYYMDSCTSAVEEFCSSSATVEVSFQLEAALFCLSAVALSVNSPLKKNCQKGDIHARQLSRCTTALSTKPVFLPANPLALAQLNRFLGMYGSWYTMVASPQALDVAFELSVSTINMSGTAFSDQEPASEMLKEMAVTPFSEAAKATRILLTRSPLHFTSQHKITLLGSAWETSYIASNRGMLKIEDREDICKGICSVVASLPVSKQEISYHAFAIPIVECLNTMTKQADTARQYEIAKLASVMPRLADELRLLSTMVKSFSVALDKVNTKSEVNKSIPISCEIQPSIGLLAKLWPCLSHIASNYSLDKHISESLGFFLVNCVPLRLENSYAIGLLRELFMLASSMILDSANNKSPLPAVYDFVERIIDLHGSKIEIASQVMVEGTATLTSNAYCEVCKKLENLILSSILSIKNSLGSAWSCDKEQGQGQPAFESKSKVILDERPTATDTLAAIFTVLSIAAVNCPIFLIHLPATIGGDRENNRLISRAIKSSVIVLVEPDFELARTAILFLVSVIELMASTESSSLRTTIENIVSSARATIVTILIAGICGGLHATLLDPAATLLYKILRTSPSQEVRTFYEVALQQEHFKLGDAARVVLAEYFSRCCTGELSDTSLMTFAEDIWDLHQYDEGRSLASSDRVAAFIEKLSSI